MQILKDHDLWHIKKNAVWSGNSFRLLRQPKKWRNNVKPENRSGICNLQCKGHELENLKMLRNKRPSVNHRVYWCKVWVRSSVAVSLAAEACDECRCSRLCTILLLMRTSLNSNHCFEPVYTAEGECSCGRRGRARTRYGGGGGRP